MQLFFVFSEKQRKICGLKLSKKRNCDTSMKTKPISTSASINEKRFECNVCFKKFQRKHNLRVHLRIHTNECPYECNQCFKKFIRAESLKRHIRCVHDKVSPFRCTICGVDLLDIDKFNAHMLKHKGGNIYSNNSLQEGNYLVSKSQ